MKPQTQALQARTHFAKIGVAAEEADESVGWLTALRDADLVKSELATPLIIEANELASIFVASAKTAAQNLAEEDRRREVQKRAPR